MQKLSVKLKNVPMDIPQVHCSTNSGLNKEETLSVQGIVLADNNLDADLTGFLVVPGQSLIKYSLCCKNYQTSIFNRNKLGCKRSFAINPNVQGHRIIADNILSYLNNAKMTKLEGNY